MQSQKLVDLLKTIVKRDVLNEQSIITFFTKRDYIGGWECWLQAEFARGVFDLQNFTAFNREVTYPSSHKKCDLWFNGLRGAGIWVELKTQRRSSYDATVEDFKTDIGKITGLSQEFRQANVLVALAVFILSLNDRTALNVFRTTRPSGGTLSYFLLDNGQWGEVTEDIINAEVGKLLMATYRAS